MIDLIRNYKFFTFMSSLENSKKIIETWKEKGNKESDEFSKFICYWIAFNCWLYTITNETKDGKALKELYNKPAECNKFIQLTDDNFKSRLENFKKVCPIKNDRENRPKKNISDVNNFKEVVGAIYQIRCNLFHGSKADENLRDSKVIRAVVPVLEIIVKNLCIV